MAITLFQVDKSGSEVFEKDYSLVVIKDKDKIYGINIPQILKDQIMFMFNTNQLNIKSTTRKQERLRLKIRFHTAIIILLLKKAIKDNSSIGEVNIQVCNDIDGHFHEIRNMIYSHLLRDLPLLEKEDIVQTKFPKTSLVDVSARNLREKNIDNAKNYVILKINIDELSKIIKK